jgi:uncharacterized protein YkwD
MRSGSLFIASVACALALAVAGCASSPPPRAPSAHGIRAAQTETFEERLLAAHNAERDRKHLPRLTWSDRLEQDARSWAEHLAHEDRMYHSDKKIRPGEGENLWSGTASFYTPGQMVGAFLAERRYFKPGVFPNVSSTGKWMDVGHYSQVIWPTTTQVGCALAHNRARDYLVCRYSPPGNYFGHQVG